VARHCAARVAFAAQISQLKQMKAWKMVDAAHADAVARGSLVLGTLGGYAQAEAARIGDGAIVQSPPPGWAFCMTMEGCRYDPNPETPKAFFEIRDMQLLMQFVMRRYEVQIAGAQSDAVQYAQRLPDGRFATPGHPFVKDAIFADEREIRMIFRPRPEIVVDKPLVTQPDYAVAGLLVRID
jgi:hypothetical protein